MKILKLLLLLLMQHTIVSADLTQYFKKLTPQDKIGNHSMKGIDFIYMINLDQRPERFEGCTKQLSPYDIHPYRFSAVNGWELSLEKLNELGVKYDKTMRQNLWGTYYIAGSKGEQNHEVMQVENRNYFSHCMAPGPVGIALSHLSVLHDAYESGHNRVWVMEDDITVHKNPHLISDLIEQLDNLVGKDGWDILFTDQDILDGNGKYIPCLGYAYRPNFNPDNPERFAQRTLISPTFMKIGARYGAHSMIVQRHAMKKLLDFFNQYNLFLPIDMDMFLPNNMNYYCLTSDIVSNTPGASSDNGAPNYKKNQK